MSTVLGIDVGSRGAIVEGRLIDALDMPCLNDGPAGRRAVNGPSLAGLDSQSVLIEELTAKQAEQAMPKGGLRSTSFKPGQSGNPHGRPKRPETIEARRVVADVKAASRELTLDESGDLIEVLDMPSTPGPARRFEAEARNV